MRALFLASAALCLAQGASAADAPSSPAPIAEAATVLTRADLELRGDPSRLLPEARVPGLSAPLVAGLGGTSAYSIRGMGAASPLAPRDPSVGSFVDGIPLAGRDGSDFALFDLEQVKVLRGGQGARLGRNTSGGAVLLTLAEPGDKVAGHVGAEIGSYDHKMVRGSIDVPLGAIAFKFSGYYQDDDGVARNTTTGERLNDNDRAGVRFAARLTPLDTLSWTVALAYTENKADNLLAFECDPAGGEGCGGRYSTTGLQKARRLGGGPQYSLPITGAKAEFGLGSRVSTTLVSSNLTWGGDALRLSLVTGYLDVGEKSVVDYADGRGLPALGPSPVRGFENGGFAVLTDGSDRQFSQEARLSGGLMDGKLSWTVGGQLIDRRTQIDSADLYTAENGTPAGLAQRVADRRTQLRTKATSAFADLGFDPTERLSLGAALRYTRETQRFSLADNALCGAGGCRSGLVGGTLPDRQSLNIWTPSARASFRLTDGLSLFADISRGYRPGGWNSLASTPGALTAYGAERAWTWQGGLASSWLDGRLDAKLTGFAIQADNFQGSGATIIDGVPQLWTGTLADWRNRGVELEFGLKPIDGLSLYANLTVQNARYRTTDAVRAQQADCLSAPAGGSCGVGIVTTAGAIAQPMRTPDLSGGFGGSFAVAIPKSGIVLTPSADLLYQGKQQTDTANTAPATGAHWLVDAGIAIETDDSFWILTFACRNCLDETVATQGLLGGAYLEQPRTLILSARRRF